jgi:hypothetical protein
MVTTQMTPKAVAALNRTVDAACDRSAAEWLAGRRREERRAYRHGYRDGAAHFPMRSAVVGADPGLRKAYRDGYDAAAGVAA